jgi:hypothetical protein
MTPEHLSAGWPSAVLVEFWISPWLFIRQPILFGAPALSFDEDRSPIRRGKLTMASFLQPGEAPDYGFHDLLPATHKHKSAVRTRERPRLPARAATSISEDTFLNDVWPGPHDIRHYRYPVITTLIHLIRRSPDKRKNAEKNHSI